MWYKALDFYPCDGTVVGVGEELQVHSELRLWCYLSDSQTEVPPVSWEDTVLGQARAALLQAGMEQDAPLYGAGHNAAGQTCSCEGELVKLSWL